MKTIGLIGGMSWQSSKEYYKIINQIASDKLGGHHSCKSIMYTFDFDPMYNFIIKEDWDNVAKNLIIAAKTLEKGGADFIIIVCNTVHMVADEVEKNINIPLLHIVDMTANKIKQSGFNAIGLIGSVYTMEKGFYKERLKTKYNIDVVVPEKSDRDYINKVNFTELDYGIIKESSRRRYIKIMEKLVDKGAEGVILGCTEIPLLVKQEHTEIPIFETTTLHAKSAVEYALK